MSEHCHGKYRIYWQPIYEMLESCFDGEISILGRECPTYEKCTGRKTDMKDAQWIATLLRAGLLKGSFIPDKIFRTAASDTVS